MSKGYGNDVVAVNDVSLTIESGSLVTLLGPSGSGKTTLLRAIAGFEDVTSGEILIDGESVAHVPTHRRRLGMVAQDYALFPHMTVKDNLEFGIKSAQRARRDGNRLSAESITRRIDEMLELVGLAGYQNRRPQQLSGGQKQRVALARALVTEPRVLLLDEPFAALDKHLREQLQVEVRRVQQQVGITTVFVTHDQGEALSMSDKIAVLNHGRVEQFASPKDIYDAPVTSFVAGFIGRINLFTGVVSAIDELGYRVAVAPDTDVYIANCGRASVGEEIKFSVRPEQMRIAASPVSENGLNGTIRQCVYLGDRIDLVVETSVGMVTSNYVSGGPGVDLFNVGDTVNVTFSPSSATLLPRGLSV